MRIDAHQHFWTRSRGDYSWLTQDLGPIYRDFGPEDITPLLTRHGIEGTVLVQAAPTVAESEFMLSIADRHPFVLGVVGWVDFESASAPADMAALASHPKFRGLRPMIQDIADPDWMLRSDLDAAFRAMIEMDLTFDALVHPKHLAILSILLARYPGMRTVIDHGAKPAIRDRAFDGWANGMARLARETDAFCKLSGLVTEAAAGWAYEDIEPYGRHLVEVFGPERLIWGSDWPVCTLAASYDRWVEVTDRLLAGLSQSERAAVLGGNAARVYKL